MINTYLRSGFNRGIKKTKAFSLTMVIVSMVVFSAQARSLDNAVVKLPQLKDQVEIITDQWGIPHIYANNQQDLFFAQGYNAARDRLFQFELWRRRALGLMAEIQGEKAVQHDIGARLLKYRGDMEQELQHYHQDGSAIVTAFVDGVNAYIKQTRQTPELLPVEFRLLGITPGYWTKEVVISRHNALTGGAQQELMLSKLLTSIGEEKTTDILSFSQTPRLKPKQNIDLSRIKDSILALYTASRKPPKFTDSDLNITSAEAEGKPLLSSNHLNPFLETLESINARGSNNWIIAGSKTASGYPILANDPHRAIQAPALRYWAHLVAPGWNVIGGGEPVLPGLSIGHNEHGAWGLTIFPIDQEDVYVYDINPQNHHQYWYDGRWETMTLLTEEIPVKNASAHRATLKYTRHGPVLYEDKEAGKAYGLRAAWLEKGAAPYLASLRMNQARDWEEFRQACTYSGLPGENMIWASRKGNIGWQAVGYTPIRIGWDGVLPVPGDGRYEWAGYVPMKSMPHQLNFSEGHWQSANHNNIPQDYPNIFNYMTASPYRLNRIQEVLQSGTALTVNDSKRLQHDVYSMTARSLVPLLSGVKPSTPPVKRFRKKLLQWDYQLSKDSIEATVFTQWQKELSDRVAAQLDVPFVAIEKLIAWLSKPASAPAGLFNSEPVAARDKLLEQSLKASIEALTQALGAKTDHWHYGQEKRKHSKLVHPFSHLLDPETREGLDIGPVPVGGNEHTVNLNVGNHNQRVGASFRMIVDTSDWDLTVGTNTPGQSSDPKSPHYKDMFKLWAQEEYFPVYFSRKAIEKVAVRKTILKPL